MGKQRSGTLLLCMAAMSAAAPLTSRAVCDTTFEPISASDWVNGINPGWNLGNTLDAVPTEGSWNNPPVAPSTFDDVKAAGFRGVRLPVTYADHFITGSPSWTVDPAWLQRVSDVVDEVISRDLFVLTNVHHDGTEWADVTASGANFTAIEERFYRLWYQIGETLACKSSLLALEPINEPRSNTAADAAEINRLQQIFINALADSGGFNSQRVVTLIGPQENLDLTSQYFVKPDNLTNPWAIQYHYYSPYDFIFSAWGKTIWPSEQDNDLALLDADLSHVRGNFSDVPLVMGEWAASPVATETAARWRYFDYIIRTAAKYNTTTILWDNGADFLNRATHTFRDEVAIDILLNAAAGNDNSLPDSTTDKYATTQSSSAYIFHELGTPVTDQTLSYLLNGNSLVSITGPSGQPLTEGTDYTISGSDITYTSSLLSTYLTSDAAPGSIANLTLTFSSGADLTANILLWSTPTLDTDGTSQPASSVPSGTDLTLPITYAGINKPATLSAVSSDGSYLIDDFTQYFGAEQEGRTTYASQWNWNGDSVVVTAAAVQAVVNKGLDTTFTFEFYPRIEGRNSVNYTLTV